MTKKASDVPRYLAALRPPDLTKGTQYEISVPAVANSLPLPFTEQELSKISFENTAGEAETISTSELSPIINCPLTEADMEQVTQRLERTLTSERYGSTFQVQEAIKRLLGLPALRHLNEWGPDIIFKAFDDIDIALFGG